MKTSAWSCTTQVWRTQVSQVNYVCIVYAAYAQPRQPLGEVAPCRDTQRVRVHGLAEWSMGRRSPAAKTHLWGAGPRGQVSSRSAGVSSPRDESNLRWVHRFHIVAAPVLRGAHVFFMHAGPKVCSAI